MSVYPGSAAYKHTGKPLQPSITQKQLNITRIVVRLSDFSVYTVWLNFKPPNNS